eukprot:TRINITY_DN9431_c0_g1_i1.p1 TRINITY_DN9431_c0_g1~~TRINITY_DN9431_c0_g1_i1.p1  ORF type:complete len:489 (+),score=67.27 TRINITY_DN9431_c0_g1_i1:95-1468(+)
MTEPSRAHLFHESVYTLKHLPKSRLEKFLSAMQGCVLFNGFEGELRHFELPGFAIAHWRVSEQSNTNLNLLLITDLGDESLNRCKILTWRKLCSFFMWNLIVVIPTSSEFQRVPAVELFDALEKVANEGMSLPWLIYAEGIGSLWFCQMFEEITCRLTIRGFLSVNNSFAWKISASSQCLFPTAVVVTDSLLTSRSIMHIESSSSLLHFLERCFLEFPGSSIGLDSLMHSFCIPWLTSVYELYLPDSAQHGICSSPNKRRFSNPNQESFRNHFDWHPSLMMAHLFELNKRSGSDGMFLKVRFAKDSGGSYLNFQLSFLPQQAAATKLRPVVQRRNSWCGTPLTGASVSGSSLNHLPESFTAVLMSSRRAAPIASWKIQRRNIETLNIPIEANWRNPSSGFHCVFACIYSSTWHDGEEMKSAQVHSQEIVTDNYAKDQVPAYILSKSQRYSNAVDLWI